MDEARREAQAKAIARMPGASAVTAVLLAASCWWGALAWPIWMLAIVVGAACFLLVYKTIQTRRPIYSQFIWLLVFWPSMFVAGGPAGGIPLWIMLHRMLQFEFTVGFVLFSLMLINRRKLLALID